MLKKLIVVTAVLALITGTAFAQVTIGGQLQQGMTLIEGNNVKESGVTSGSSYMGSFNHEAKFSFLFGDGKAGGRLVWTLNSQAMWGWLQWRPNQYFRVKVGSDGDGEWGFPQIAGWGFTGEAKNSVAAVNDWGGGMYMSYRNIGLNYGGFDGAGAYHLGLSAWPVDMLQLNLLFRDIDKSMPLPERLAKLQFIVIGTIEEVGTIRFAAVGEGGLMKDAADGDDLGNLFLAFHSASIVQGLGFEVGLRWDPPRKGDIKNKNEDKTFDNFNIGFGLNLTKTDPFNLKIRGNVGFAGKNAGETRNATFGFHVLPSYKLPKLTIFFHAGVGMEFVKDPKPNQDKVNYEFFLNPYIWVPMGGMRMWVGFQFLDDHRARQDDKFQFKWRIPFGFNFYF